MTFLPQRLLCLVDLSQASATVLSWARLLALTYRAQVDVFHAAWAPNVDIPEGSADDEGPSSLAFEVMGTEIEGRVNALADDAFGGKVKFDSRLVEGHPVKMVLQEMAHRPPDLVLLGSHGYDGFARVLLGSVAENVMRTAPCPILVVKGAPLPAAVTTLRTILCAVDLGDFSRRCLSVAGDLAGMLEAELHVIHVIGRRAQIAAARSALSAWIPDDVRSTTPVREVVLQGEPGEMIVTYARRTPADLAIVAAEHRPFLEYTTLGRTTERVVRFNPCSVLVIPKLTGKPEFAIVEPGSA